MSAFIFPPSQQDPMGLNAQNSKTLRWRLEDQVHVWPACAHDAGSKADHAGTIACNGNTSTFPGGEETEQANHRGAARPRLGLR
eukprot:14875989-Alexandrium_andersonii.AAC.1